METNIYELGADALPTDDPLMLHHLPNNLQTETFVQFFLDKGYNIDEKDENGLTPLIKAVLDNNENLCDILIAKGANTSCLNKCRDTEGNSLLAYLLLLGREIPRDPSHYLYSIDINSRNIYGQTLLLLSLLNFKNELAKYLIVNEADLSAPIGNVFHYLNAESDLDLIQLLLDKGLDINEFNTLNLSPLMNALLKNYEGLARRLIEKGASIKPLRTIDSYGVTFFTDLIDAGAAASCQFLIENKLVDIDHSNLKINYFAKKNQELFKLKVISFIDVNTELYTYVTMALEYNYLDIAKCLILHGASLQAPSGNLLDYLHNNASEEILDLLIEKGLQLDAINREGKTALGTAIHLNKFELFQLLFLKQTQTKPLEDPFQLLFENVESGNFRICQFLIDNIGKLKIAKLSPYLQLFNTKAMLNMLIDRWNNGDLENIKWILTHHSDLREFAGFIPTPQIPPDVNKCSVFIAKVFGLQKSLYEALNSNAWDRIATTLNNEDARFIVTHPSFYSSEIGFLPALIKKLNSFNFEQIERLIPMCEKLIPPIIFDYHREQCLQYAKASNQPNIIRLLVSSSEQVLRKLLIDASEIKSELIALIIKLALLDKLKVSINAKSDTSPINNSEIKSYVKKMLGFSDDQDTLYMDEFQCQNHIKYFCSVLCNIKQPQFSFEMVNILDKIITIDPTDILEEKITLPDNLVAEVICHLAYAVAYIHKPVENTVSNTVVSSNKRQRIEDKVDGEPDEKKLRSQAITVFFNTGELANQAEIQEDLDKKSRENYETHSTRGPDIT